MVWKALIAVGLLGLLLVLLGTWCRRSSPPPSAVGLDKPKPAAKPPPGVVGSEHPKAAEEPIPDARTLIEAALRRVAADLTEGLAPLLAPEDQPALRELAAVLNKENEGRPGRNGIDLHLEPTTVRTTATGVRCEVRRRHRGAFTFRRLPDGRVLVDRGLTPFPLPDNWLTVIHGLPPDPASWVKVLADARALRGLTVVRASRDPKAAAERLPFVLYTGLVIAEVDADRTAVKELASPVPGQRTYEIEIGERPLSLTLKLTADRRALERLSAIKGRPVMAFLKAMTAGHLRQGEAPP